MDGVGPPDENDDFPPDEIRAPDEVARRALAVLAVVGLAGGADRKDVVAWLGKNGLRDALAPSEVAFIEAPAPTQKQMIDGVWMSECLIVLLWALGYVEQLPPADEQCDPALFQTVLPPFAPVSVGDFVGAAKLRPDEQLWDMAEVLLGLHWQARDAKLRGGTPRDPVDIEIIQERHHAINWITGYDGAEWDEVTTDT